MSRTWRWRAAGLTAVLAVTAVAYLGWPRLTNFRMRPDDSRLSSWPKTAVAGTATQVSIIKAARNDATHSRFRVKFDVAGTRDSYLFIDCDTGTYALEMEGGQVTGPCRGAATMAYGGGFRDDLTITATVSGPQRSAWGVAYYK